MRFWRSHLSRRMVSLMILASAGLAMLAACVQLYVSYQQDVSDALLELDVIDQSFRPGLENALWEFNFQQVEAILDGIIAQAHVEYLKLDATTGQTWSRGNADAGEYVAAPFVLTHLVGAETDEVGTLQVQLSLDSVRSNLVEQLLVLVLSNFAKAILAALAMLLIFDRMVARHLRELADQTRQQDWFDPDGTISLARQPFSSGDEIEQIASALNAAGETIRTTHQARLDDRLTAERKRQSEIATVHHQTEAIMSAASIGIVALDNNARVVRINPQARSLLGDLQEDVPFPWPPGVSFLEADTLEPLISSSDPIQRAILGHDLKGETRLLRRPIANDDPTYVRLDSTQIREDLDGNTTVLVMVDVSEDQRNRQAAERKNRLDALGQMTGGIAHDFNNLLSATLFSVDLLRDEDDAGERRELLEIAERSILRGRDLTSRLLAFAKEKPGLTTNCRVVDVLEEFEKLIEPVLEKQIERSVICQNPDLYVECDRAQLETALMNLFLNSRDAIIASGKGHHIAVSAREGTNSATDTDIVEISVTDNGPGMDDETMSRATDPFFSTKGDAAGTGLGLSMVYGFVLQSKGDLKIASRVGEGTTITLTLPRGHDAPKVRDAPVEPSFGTGQTILLVEDEDTILTVTKKVIETLGYQVKTARSGAEAMSMIEAGDQFDLLLTDVVMPGPVGGFELAQFARDAMPEVPVIYASGYTGFSRSEMGAVQAPLLKKPVMRHELAESIAEAFQSPRFG